MRQPPVAASSPTVPTSCSEARRAPRRSPNLGGLTRGRWHLAACGSRTLRAQWLSHSTSKLRQHEQATSAGLKDGAIYLLEVLRAKYEVPELRRQIVRMRGLTACSEACVQHPQIFNRLMIGSTVVFSIFPDAGGGTYVLSTRPLAGCPLNSTVSSSLWAGLRLPTQGLSRRVPGSSALRCSWINAT